MTERSKKSKTKYTDEFRADAVRLVIDEELPVAQVARDLGMPQNTLHSWVKKARTHHSSSEGPLSKDERDELHRLRRELRIVREEREILKKAAAFFALASR
jgi:transposase